MTVLNNSLTGAEIVKLARAIASRHPITPLAGQPAFNAADLPEGDYRDFMLRLEAGDHLNPDILPFD